ncbi:glycosyltransferase [Shewanella basaltis]|uniref:glycosyltransferase n=1 Tax=Shewanella basaltis TaxID=472183 RepID=UPI003AAAAB89
MKSTNLKKYTSVIHVVESISDDYGGPARSIPMMCFGMENCGLKNFVFSVNRDDEKNILLDNSNVGWCKSKPGIINKYYFSLDFYFNLKCKIVELINKGEVFYIHVHSVWSFPTLFVFLLCNRYGIEYILTPRSSLQLASISKKRFFKSLLRFLFVDKFVCKATHIHLTSKQEESEFSINFDNNNIINVENGLDFTEFEFLPERLAAKKQFDLPSDSKVLLFLSRINERKGLDLLFDAFCSLKVKGNDNLYLLIAGPDDNSEILKNIYARSVDLGVSKYIKYVGMLVGDARLKAYSAADVFILPTKFENFGMSIAEALASGVPVITTKDTPWSILESNNFGKICTRDAPDIERCITDVLHNTYNKNEMFDYVKSNFDYNVQSKRILSLISK